MVKDWAQEPISWDSKTGSASSHFYNLRKYLNPLCLRIDQKQEKAGTTVKTKSVKMALEQGPTWPGKGRCAYGCDERVRERTELQVALILPRNIFSGLHSFSG